MKLFVYGTLRETFPAPGEAALALRSHGQYIGPAWAYGALFLVDWYPGFSAEGDTKIHGDLYHVPDDKKLLDILDSYEELDFENPCGSEYIKQQIHVFINNRSISATTYIYNRDIQVLPSIPSGDFLNLSVLP